MHISRLISSRWLTERQIKFLRLLSVSVRRFASFKPSRPFLAPIVAGHSSASLLARLSSHSDQREKQRGRRPQNGSPFTRSSPAAGTSVSCSLQRVNESVHLSGRRKTPRPARTCTWHAALHNKPATRI